MTTNRFSRVLSLLPALLVVLRSPAAAEFVKETVLKGNGNDVNAVAFSPDGRLLASAHKAQFAKLWSIPDGR
ncbi:MAG TPA: hypothetical protein VLG15_03010, partial [Thermoanaerobaculia bacterium]|nr:hypothetical protein [Thermoanaerobaculia bacterium]